MLVFQGFSWLAGIHDFWFLQFQPELLTSIIINCQCFDYSAVVFFRNQKSDYVSSMYTKVASVNIYWNAE